MIRSRKSDKGVKPIVSVILMISLSIILASVVSGIAFDLIDKKLENPYQTSITELSVNDDQKQINVSYSNRTDSKRKVSHVKLLDDNGDIVSVSSGSNVTLSYPESDEEYEIVAVSEKELTVNREKVKT